MNLRTLKFKFILEEFLKKPIGIDPYTKTYKCLSIENSLQSEEGCFRAAEFYKQFPTKIPDDNHIKAAARIRRLLKQMEAAGVVRRYRKGRYANYFGEHPGWCYEYRIDEDVLKDIKENNKSINEVAIDIDTFCKEKYDITYHPK